MFWQKPYWLLFSLPLFAVPQAGPSPEKKCADLAFPNSAVTLALPIRDGKVDRTRPLCPYPQIAVYNKSGDVNDPASFNCATPGSTGTTR